MSSETRLYAVRVSRDWFDEPPFVVTYLRRAGSPEEARTWVEGREATWLTEGRPRPFASQVLGVEDLGWPETLP